MTLGDKLQALRKKNNLSQEQAAEKLNTSRNTVSRWEKSQCIPEADKLVAISELYSISLDYLLKDKPTDTDMGKIPDLIPLRALFWCCTAANMLGLIFSMFGWHGLQSAFSICIGLLINIFSLIFFEVLLPKNIKKEMVCIVRKRFYMVNTMILLPTPIYVGVEIVCFDYDSIISLHLMPVIIYSIVAALLGLYLIYRNKK